MAHNFAEKLLVWVAREIHKGGKISKENVIKGVLADCFPTDGDATNQELWQELIAKHLDHLVTTSEVPFIRFLHSRCDHCPEQVGACIKACPTDAILLNEDGSKEIDHDLCIECGHCVDACITGSVVERSEFVQVAKMLFEEEERPVYAIPAPSVAGQFGVHVKPGQLRGALRILGFSDVYEVALGADLITKLEAEEFIHRHKSDSFMITSCCCPAFIKLVEKRKPHLSHVVSNSVSPMIAVGRLLKAKEPHCRVVFIGPCIAKKSEAKLPDLSDAIDCVITYKEAKALFDAVGIDLASAPELPLEDASSDGRNFAHTGGVTQAICNAINKLDPSLEVVPVQGNGIKQCNELLGKAEEGLLDANFMEGMACPGGCVGGPGTIIHSDNGKEQVQRHARLSAIETCLDNHQVGDWLQLIDTERLLSSKRREDVIIH